MPSCPNPLNPETLLQPFCYITKSSRNQRCPCKDMPCSNTGFRHQYCSWHSPHMIVPVQNFPLGELCICFLSAYLSRRGQRIQSGKGRLGMLINVASDFIKPGKALLPATGSRNEECQKTNSQKIFHRPDYKSIRTFPCPDAYYKMVTQTQKLPFWGGL